MTIIYYVIIFAIRYYDDIAVLCSVVAQRNCNNSSLSYIKNFQLIFGSKTLHATYFKCNKQFNTQLPQFVPKNKQTIFVPVTIHSQLQISVI